MQRAGLRHTAKACLSSGPLASDASPQDALGADFGAADGAPLHMVFDPLPFSRGEEAIDVIGNLGIGEMFRFRGDHLNDSFSARNCERMPSLYLVPGRPSLRTS